MGKVLSDFGEGYQVKPAPGASIIKAANTDKMCTLGGVLVNV